MFGLLVRIFHKALIFFGKPFFDGFIRFFHDAGHVLWSFAFGEDRVVNGHGQRMPVQELGGAWHDIERAVQVTGTMGSWSWSAN